MDFEYGKCCICKGECNPSSQSCSACSRELTGYSLGWNNSDRIEKYLDSWVVDPEPPKTTPSNIARRRNRK